MRNVRQIGSGHSRPPDGRRAIAADTWRRTASETAQFGHREPFWFGADARKIRSAKSISGGRFLEVSAN